MARLHLAPTELARTMLLREGVAAEAIELTGNTVVDAARQMAALLPADGAPPVGAPVLGIMMPLPPVLLALTGCGKKSSKEFFAAQTKDRPFFLYVAFGAMHAPHQAPQSYLDKWRGKFDEGYEVIRQRWFDRQLELGIVPPDTTLAPLNPGVPRWTDLTDNQRAFSCRLQEAFAAMLEHTDDQIGRLVAYLEDRDLIDDTVILVMSDNGASREGGPFGVMDEFSFFNGMWEDIDAIVADRLDDIGGPHSHSNYPWGWAQAGNTPFKWYKQNTHEGGVHVPMIVHWPARIAEGGGVRHQFHHVNDIVPTIYEAIGITPPDTYRGFEQMPVTGTPYCMPASTLLVPEQPPR